MTYENDKPSLWKGKLTIEIPEERLAGILLSKAHDYQAKMEEEELVKDALLHPVGTPRLKELVRGKDNIVMIASDHTRPVPSKVIMPAVLEEIKQGNPGAKVTVLIATGFHRPTTREELISKFGEETVDHPDIRFVVHESGKQEDMVSLGKLPSGGELLINKIAWEADLLISEGFIEPHFLQVFPEEERACCRESPAEQQYWQTTARSLLMIPMPELEFLKETLFTGI